MKGQVQQHVQRGSLGNTHRSRRTGRKERPGTKTKGSKRGRKLTGTPDLKEVKIQANRAILRGKELRGRKVFYGPSSRSRSLALRSPSSQHGPRGPQRRPSRPESGTQRLWQVKHRCRRQAQNVARQHLTPPEGPKQQ